MGFALDYKYRAILSFPDVFNLKESTLLYGIITTAAVDPKCREINI
jgi:hypothetical protein